MAPTWMTRAKKAASLAVASALVLGAGAAGAYAADGLGPGNIDPDHKGSITLFKHENQTSATPTVGDPTSSTDSLAGKSNTVKGAEFIAFPFTNLNLTGEGANANWTKLDNLTQADLNNSCAAITEEGTGSPTLEGFTFGAGQKFAPTDAEGKTKLENLAVGAYLICEYKAPEGVTRTAAPILVTIPYPDNERQGATNKWIYDVTMYPKNTVSKLDKTIEDQNLHGLGIGSEVHYPVTATIPGIPATDHFNEFIIEDPMDDRFDPASLGVESVKLNGTAMDSGDWRYAVQGNTVWFSLTQAGLIKAKNNPGAALEVVFKGKLARLGTDGTIPNKAKLYFSHKPQDNPPPTPPTPPTTPPPGVPPIPSIEVQDKWGDFVLRKHDGNDPKQALAGATFQVYEAANPYAETCGTEIAKDDQGNDKLVTFPQNSGTVNSFTTGADGVVKIPGLFISDSIRAPQNAEKRCYVLKETKAPDGYVQLKDPIAIEVKAGTTTAGTYDTEIANEKPVIPGLPLTGSETQMILQIAGAMLVAGGLAVYGARRMRSRDNA
ncbi:SpaH/EbpB family LPXTG-anchored major pilin [Nanchangia anserum]|uniref:SpaH/EbpB family LPXTG-anchored major pilin n=1 Tax=Nanchangia anserum TaxID=2692125 RepID=A0A8I0GEK2_9ACTO|nr:SpaH/EbpB family LPXTG-anchored major pilin [Nanchangia anserum]MBD3689412.1 SpaH/EbpB family LPXTG-anchored major pilin [Nanchangia anserum]QOX81618.1 SpaH/EbpB family LPXTG-anchored major pilin [Nanchangia anserum]